MTKKANEKPELKKPNHLDLKKGRLIAERIIQENIEWLKEMAKK